MDPRYIRDDRNLVAAGMATKLEIALALLALRKGVKLTQSEVAQRAGWKTTFVSRLESLEGRLPNLTTILRYAKVCGVEVGLVFTDHQSGPRVVRGALTLQSQLHGRLFEAYQGRVMEIPATGGEER